MAVSLPGINPPRFRVQLVTAFNEWMRRAIEEPARFSREWQDVERFKADEAAGVAPSYGESCTAWLEQLIGEQEDEERREALSSRVD